jgi:hypothetical protein
MLTTQEKLDTLFAKLRSLPEERKALAVEALVEIVEDVYMLSDDERRCWSLHLPKPSAARTWSTPTSSICSTSHGLEAAAGPVV